MTGNETREPTLAEVMEEVKKSRDETIKWIDETIKGINQESNRAVVFMLVALGASIVLFGLSCFIGRITSTWSIWLMAIPMGAGLLLMIEAALMAKSSRREDSKDK